MKFQDEENTLSLCILDHLSFQHASFDDLYYGMGLTAQNAPKINKVHLLCELEALIECDHVKAYLNQGQGHYHITLEGFDHWQQHRRPDWKRFIRYQTQLDKQNQVEHWHIQAQCKEVILDFIEIHQSLGLLPKCEIRLNPKPVELTKLKQVEGYESQFQCQHLFSSVANSRVEELRSWWSNAAELGYN